MFLNLIDERVILVVNLLAKIFNNEIPHNFIKFMIFSHQKIGIIIILDPLRKFFYYLHPLSSEKKIQRDSEKEQFNFVHCCTLWNNVS